MKRALHTADEGRADSLMNEISTVCHVEDCAVGVRQALILIALAFATVGFMRLVLAILHTGGQLW